MFSELLPLPRVRQQISNWLVGRRSNACPSHKFSNIDFFPLTSPFLFSGDIAQDENGADNDNDGGEWATATGEDDDDDDGFHDADDSTAMDSNGIQEPPAPMMGYDDEDEEEEDYGEEEDEEMESVGDDKEEQGSDDEDEDNGDVDLEANQPEKASAEAVKVAESCIAGEANETRVLMPSKSVSAD